MCLGNCLTLTYSAMSVFASAAPFMAGISTRRVAEQQKRPNVFVTRMITPYYVLAGHFVQAVRGQLSPA
jgi:hypothetical protein